MFEVETYPTLLQLTSTVTAELQEGKDAIDLLKNIYPCGSITGAPKIRAMEIIDALEASPRGPYCGAIGRLAPDGGAAFNVAIRTLTLRSGERTARLGLGSLVLGLAYEMHPLAEVIHAGPCWSFLVILDKVLE